MRSLPPPSSVIWLPPSIVTLANFAGSRALPSVIVALPPQSNVIAPPFASALFSAASVQLAAVPVPTTVAPVVGAARELGLRARDDERTAVVLRHERIAIAQIDLLRGGGAGEEVLRELLGEIVLHARASGPRIPQERVRVGRPVESRLDLLHHGL